MRQALNFSRSVLLLAFLAILSMGIFLIASQFTFRLGFPLDDAWIHQTYARNLALHGEWAFLPDQPSAGSTSPLWSGLLALGFILRLGPYVWTYLLGGVLLWGLAVLGFLAFNFLNPARPTWRLWAAVLLVLEWHLVWAAGSGMETILFAFLVLLALTWLLAGWKHWFLLGLIIGLTAWVRPDGVTLLGPAIVILLMDEIPWRRRMISGAGLLVGFFILFGPYLLFNRLLAGAWWPNTFYAKQAEYAIYGQFPFWQRFAAQAGLPLVGVGVVLLPGFLYLTWHAFRRRSWGILAGIVWAVGYLGLYAWRLPVTYQHGRYVIPMMPVYFLWGWAGLSLWARTSSPILGQRVLSRAWVISVGIILVLFWGLGARAYARDVAFIESEMVTTAHWIAENTPPGALVAAHDIGALGYFGQRQLLDLAGLVSPEVIPFIRDEPRLREFLDSQGADYLVTFPGWYPSLVRGVIPVFQSQGKFAPDQGGENMVVYLWRSP